MSEPEDPEDVRLAATQPQRRSRASPSIPPSIGPGSLIDGTYRLDHALGEGAMGVVFLGRDLRLERDVAIKFIQPELVRSEEAHQRFLTEARTMARVRHVNVVDIYAFGEVAGSPYFAMEYVPGSTVGDWLRERAPLSVDEAIGILDQICRGVTAIHAAGAVHRDLKPNNVLIGPAFRVCVADLGLARVLHRSSADDSTISGTPAYMAPEVILGGPLTEKLQRRADVYSLGVMAFELLTGRLPFLAREAEAMMLAHIELEPPLLTEVRPELPAAFDAVIARALVKDPAERTESAEALERELLAARAATRVGVSKARILVADDDADFRELVEETLRFGLPEVEIESVSDGEAALAAADRRPAALAIIDLDMPGLNGLELTAALRASPRAAEMPIVVVTATGGAPDWRLLSALGADGFLVKPLDPMGLLTLVRRILDASGH